MKMLKLYFSLAKVSVSQVVLFIFFFNCKAILIISHEKEITILEQNSNFLLRYLEFFSKKNSLLLSRCSTENRILSYHTSFKNKISIHYLKRARKRANPDNLCTFAHARTDEKEWLFCVFSSSSLSTVHFLNMVYNVIMMGKRLCNPWEQISTLCGQIYQCSWSCDNELASGSAEWVPHTCPKCHAILDRNPGSLHPCRGIVCLRFLK